MRYGMQYGRKEIGDRTGRNDEMYVWQTGQGSWCLAPSVSIKDRPLLAVLTGDGTVLTAYQE